jgi:hypothetical protein
MRRYRKIGRIERIMRRMLAESDGWPIHVRDVLARAYPGQPRINGHYVALYLARRRGKVGVRLRRGLIGPTRELMARIRGEPDLQSAPTRDENVDER